MHCYKLVGVSGFSFGIMYSGWQRISVSSDILRETTAECYQLFPDVAGDYGSASGYSGDAAWDRHFGYG